MKYSEIKEKSYHIEQKGIFYAFSNEQFAEGLRREGYISENETVDDFKNKGIKLVTDGLGGYGTQEAFEERKAKYKAINDEIVANCKPEEIFAYEWWNHECGLSYDYSDALAITKEYFPKFKVTKTLLNKLQKRFEELNCY